MSCQVNLRASFHKQYADTLWASMNQLLEDLYRYWFLITHDENTRKSVANQHAQVIKSVISLHKFKIHLPTYSFGDVIIVSNVNLSTIYQDRT